MQSSEILSFQGKFMNMRKPALMNLSELRAIELVYEVETEVSAEDIVAFTKI